MIQVRKNLKSKALVPLKHGKIIKSSTLSLPPRTRIGAVLTGDIIDSTSYKGRVYDRMLRHLSTGLVQVDRAKSSGSMFRGDSFQLMLNPGQALREMLRLRAHLRSASGTLSLLDARMSLAIGLVGSPSKVMETNGSQAFIRSGRGLESLEKHRTLAVSVGSPTIDVYLGAAISLLDALSRKWTEAQCQALYLELGNVERSETAKKLKITPAAVSVRLKNASIDHIKDVLQAYEVAIKSLNKAS